MRYLSRRSHSKNYLEGESYALNMIGVVYRNISKYNEAILIHIEARDLANRAENVELIVLSLNMLGVDNRRLDLIRIALEYHKEALDLAEAIKNPSSDLLELQNETIEIISNPSDEEMNNLISMARVHVLHTDQSTGVKLKHYQLLS